QARIAVLDIELATPGGTPLAALRGLSVFGVSREFGHGTAAARPAAARPGATAPAALTPRVRTLLAHGIAPGEGFAALEQALALRLPQIVVTPFDVVRAAQWLSQPASAARLAAPAAATPGHRGHSGAGQEPRDDVERALAAIYADLLGVAHPGI